MDKKLKNVHTCPLVECGASFTRPSKLQHHLLSHTNCRPFQCPDAVCTKAYTSKSHLDRHIKSVHSETSNNVIHCCPVCLKRYANRQNLKRHITVKHLSKPEFICDFCKAPFNKKHLLMTHMYQHTGIKSFGCTECSALFVSLRDRKRHMRCHKTHVCTDCPLVFNMWTHYMKHKKEAHVQNEYICDECGASFKERIYIVQHLRTIHFKPDSRVFKCFFINCDRTYSRNSNLKQHILTAHQGVGFNCHLCSAKMTTKASMQRHVLKMHGERGPKKPPKTLKDGRKPRKDKGIPKTSIASKIFGFIQPILNNKTNSDFSSEESTSPVKNDHYNLEDVSINISLASHIAQLSKLRQPPDGATDEGAETTFDADVNKSPFSVVVKVEPCENTGIQDTKNICLDNAAFW